MNTPSDKNLPDPGTAAPARDASDRCRPEPRPREEAGTAKSPASARKRKRPFAL
jgi:hypothetical protein